MMISIPTLISNTVVSAFIGQIFGHFSSHYSANAHTLNDFLNTLSSDFANRVEGIVRAAFSNNTFAQIKSDIMTAAISYRTYAASKDKTHLDFATIHILKARSTLFVEAKALCSVSMRTLMENNNPAQKGQDILTNINALDSAMSALTAIAALDITILATYAEIVPALKTEIITRCTENIDLAQTLKQEYYNRQSIRCLVIKETDFFKNHPSQGITGNYKMTYYKDGIAVDSRIRMACYYVNQNEFQKFKDKAYMELVSKCQWDNSQVIYKNAENKLNKDPGNIDAAIKLWDAVKAYYLTI